MAGKWVYIIVSASMLLLGVGLIFKGIWPRRRGEDPHCRRCGYNLTGLAGEICPECGQALGAGAIVRGERHRRPGRIVVGLALIVLGGAVPVGMVIGASWNPYLPSVVLVAKCLNPVTGADALVELISREAAGRLGWWSRGRLINLCLAAQGASAAGPLTQKQVEFLGSCWRNKRLTKAQEETFFRQMVTPELKVRQRVRVGEKVAWDVTTARRCMPVSFLYQLSKGKIVDNGRVAIDEPGHLAQILHNGASHPLLPMTCEQSGPHEVKLEATAEIYVDPYGPGNTNTIGPSPQGQPCIQFPVTLSATYEGIPADAPDILRVANPSVRQHILDNEHFYEMVVRQGYDPQARRWCRMLLIGKWGSTHSMGGLPVGVAFRVFARVGDQEYEIGEARGERGGTMSQSGRGAPYDGPVPKTVDLILRASEEVARKTGEIYEIWDGEVVYRDVPVRNEDDGEQSRKASERRKP